MQGEWTYTGLKGMILGFNGALSTVSTFVVEIYRFLPLMKGRDSYARSLGYTLLSMFLGTIFVVATYVWATV